MNSFTLSEQKSVMYRVSIVVDIVFDKNEYWQHVIATFF